MANDEDKKIKGIGATTRASEVEKLKEVDRVKAAGAVSGVKGASGIASRRATTIMTAAEREKFFRMIEEEADKLAESGAIPKRDKAVVSKAVKMAIDSGVLDED